MKTCSRCNEEKQLSEFYSTQTFKRYKFNVDYLCKTCRNGFTLSHHRGNPNVICTVDECEKRHYAKGYCRTHYDRVRMYGRTEAFAEIVPLDKEKRIVRNVNGKEVISYYSLERRLKHKYKMTVEQWYAFAEKGCNVCGVKIEEAERNLHVDHDHKCCPGKLACGECIRGVVCNSCNTSIGLYEKGRLRNDYPNRQKIIAYLENYNKRVKKLENIKAWHDIIVDPENKRQEW